MTTENLTSDELSTAVEKSLKDGILPVILHSENKQYLNDICQRLNLNKIEVGSVLIGVANFITKYQEEGWDLYLRRGDEEIKIKPIKEFESLKNRR